MDWLTDFTNWLREQFVALWDAFTEFMGDMIVKVADAMLDWARWVMEAIPVPDFLSDYSICGLLSQAGSTTAWVVTTFRIGEGLGLLAIAFGIRMLRKLLTLFQW